MKAGTRQQSISLALCRRRRNAIGAAFAVALALLPGQAPAGTAGLPSGLPDLPSLTQTTHYDSQSGLALRGYDPVAYRIEQRAVAGDRSHELVYRGAAWRFVSAANREAFREAPEIYAPAFAGFDASAVAHGRAVDTDPREFAIIGTRLFLFRTAENRRSFVADSALRQQADGNWATVAQTIAR